jgi:hypothetical protein
MMEPCSQYAAPAKYTNSFAVTALYAASGCGFTSSSGESAGSEERSIDELKGPAREAAAVAAAHASVSARIEYLIVKSGTPKCYGWAFSKGQHAV